MLRRHQLYLPALFLSMGTTWCVSLLHLGVFPDPPESLLKARPEVVAKARFLPHGDASINQLVLFGTPYERGLAEGALTKDLLAQEEAMLVAEFERFFPNPIVRWGLLLGTMRWFWGIDRYFPTWATAEMRGVAASAPVAFDGYADGYTRQIAYHGVHELGQMFVDFDKQDFGCTLLGVSHGKGWLLGRNFDFEAVRLLDTEKIVKWVFPDEGHAYVAVTWAGMVGLVTGVNDRGVYVSINAAGSADFQRYGTPTTIVALQALQEANTAREAVAIIEQAPVFITDLFVVADRDAGELFRIEKTPARVRTVQLQGPSAVTNHLMDPLFADDKINGFRMREQTTVARYQRAKELVTQWQAPAPGEPLPQLAQSMAQMLRDRSGFGGGYLHAGNRTAIDALIATHSVIYATDAGALWVSRGPALTGAYVGFDLAKTFQRREPVLLPGVDADPAMAEPEFYAFQGAMMTLKDARAALRSHDCVAARDRLSDLALARAQDHYEVLTARADYASLCAQDEQEARGLRRKALAARPAYAKHERALREAL